MPPNEYDEITGNDPNVPGRDLSADDLRSLTSASRSAIPTRAQQRSPRS
jgi:hypothetical protein